MTVFSSKSQSPTGSQVVIKVLTWKTLASIPPKFLVNLHSPLGTFLQLPKVQEETAVLGI